MIMWNGRLFILHSPPCQISSHMTHNSKIIPDVGQPERTYRWKPPTVT